MNRFRLVLLTLMLFIPLIANGQDWQENLAKTTEDMPSLKTMRDQGIVNSYIDEIGSNFVGETEDDQQQNGFSFAVTRLKWLSVCSLLYARESEDDDGWVAQYRMDLVRRHLDLFAAATVETIDPSTTADELAASMMDNARATDGPYLNEWLNSPEGREHRSYKQISGTCSDNLRNIMRFEK